MKFYFSLISLLLVFLYGSAQKSFTDDFKYMAVYHFAYQPDSTDVNSQKSEEMLLYLGEKSSRFSSAGKAMKDHILKNRNKLNRSAAEFSRIQSQTPQTSLDYSIFKHYPSAEMSYTETVALEKFRYPEELALFDWEIGEERKEIAGYQAQKAITGFAGRDYIAWFTAEIPVPDGPYKFNGLPGLILEIRDTKDHYVFKLTQFGPLKESEKVEFRSSDYISTNRKKFLQVKKEYNKDPITATERAGIKFGFKPGQRERMHREHLIQLKKRNNPIELE